MRAFALAALLVASLAPSALAAENATLTGFVLADDGSPVVGALVGAWGMEDGQEAETDAEGRFSFRVAPGCWYVEAWPSVEQESALGRSASDTCVRLAAGESKTVNLTLPRLIELRGVVTYPDGEPAARVDLRVGGESATTGPDGAYVVRGMPQGRHGFLVKYDVPNTNGGGYQSNPFCDDTESGCVTVDAAPVQFHNATIGRPQNVTVRVTNQGAAAWGRVTIFGADEAGTTYGYTFLVDRATGNASTRFPPGAYNVAFESLAPADRGNSGSGILGGAPPDSFRACGREPCLIVRDQPVHQDVALPPRVTIRGNLTDAEGLPIEGASIWFSGPHVDTSSVPTNATGAYELNAFAGNGTLLAGARDDFGAGRSAKWTPGYADLSCGKWHEKVAVCVPVDVRSNSTADLALPALAPVEIKLQGARLAPTSGAALESARYFLRLDEHGPEGLRGAAPPGVYSVKILKNHTNLNGPAECEACLTVTPTGGNVTLHIPPLVRVDLRADREEVLYFGIIIEEPTPEADWGLDWEKAGFGYVVTTPGRPLAIFAASVDGRYFAERAWERVDDAMEEELVFHEAETLREVNTSPDTVVRLARTIRGDAIIALSRENDIQRVEAASGDRQIPMETDFNLWFGLVPADLPKDAPFVVTLVGEGFQQQQIELTAPRAAIEPTPVSPPTPIDLPPSESEAPGAVVEPSATPFVGALALAGIAAAVAAARRRR